MFKFRLEPLITIRDNDLKERQAELAQAYNAQRICEENLQTFERLMEEGIATARNMMQPGQMVDVRYLRGLQEQELVLRANHEEWTKNLRDVSEEVERRRLLVVAANKELKKVEKLKEKRYEEYSEKEKKQETKAMDEIAGNRRYTEAG